MSIGNSSTEERVKKIFADTPLISSEKLRRQLKEEGFPGTGLERLYRNHRRTLGVPVTHRND